MAASPAQPRVISIGAVSQPLATVKGAAIVTTLVGGHVRVVMALHQVSACRTSCLPHPSELPAADPVVTAAPRRASSTPAAPTAVQERLRVRQPYPNYRVIVLDDDVNTFQHVVEALVRHLPGMGSDRAWELAHRIDGEGSAVVWRGPQEQAELYHQLLTAEGLTMAPLERDG